MTNLVGSLQAHELATRLSDSGIVIQTGRFATRIRSPIRSVAEGLHSLYADFPLADPDFADFHISLDRPRTLRRWVRKQVQFYFDGRTPFKPLPYAQAFPMLEWGLNWCVANHAHRYLILHAAAIEKDGCGVILPAPPGSGKSTLCAALVTRGWRLLSDELALLDLDDGTVAPLARPVSLKNRSIDVVREFAPDAIIGPVVHDTSKGSIAHLRPPRASVMRAGERMVPACVVFPKWAQGHAAELRRVPRARGALRLAENAFNFPVLGELGFQALARMVDATQCHDFVYGSLEDAIGTFAGLVRERARDCELVSA